MAATFDALTELGAVYDAARLRLVKVIANPKSTTSAKQYARAILKQLEIELKRMHEANARFVSKTIPKEYRDAVHAVTRAFKRAGIPLAKTSTWATIHVEAIHELAREMQYQLGSGLETVGRQVRAYVSQAQDQALRTIGLEESAAKVATGSTVTQMRNAMIDRMQREALMTVQTRDGRQMRIERYAELVSRSTTREAGNAARINQLQDNGHDLVKMTTHYPTCKICAPLQGRVYSISGKSARFPSLSRAFQPHYKNVHPNCRHSVHPWIEGLQTPEEVEETVRQSNKPWEDDRTPAEKDLYIQQQAEARKLRNDEYQYERYQQVLGPDAPKSFSAFRRAKNANGERWEQLQQDYRETLAEMREQKEEDEDDRG